MVSLVTANLATCKIGVVPFVTLPLINILPREWTLYAALPQARSDGLVTHYQVLLHRDGGENNWRVGWVRTCTVCKERWPWVWYKGIQYCPRCEGEE